jgi:hypothetical protein
MNLNTATITKLLALANKILTEHGAELVAILRAAGTIQAPVITEPPPVTPVPLPEPLPYSFNETFYLTTYPDVAAAVAKGVFKTGGDHYLLHGRAEGRKYRPDPVVVAPPAPVLLPVEAWAPKAAYANSQALVADLKANNFTAMVAVDGFVVYQGDGFGPPMGFYMWRDGSVRQEDSGQLPLPLDGEIINLNP